MASSNLRALSFIGNDMSSGDMYSGAFFEPDIMLPEQFNSQDESGVDGGERKLMAAILSDGIEAFMEQVQHFVNSAGSKGGFHKHDAIDWVENKDASYVFSFDNVCTSLGIDPEYLRYGLTRYVQSLKKAYRNNLTLGEHGEVTTWKKIRRPRTK